MNGRPYLASLGRRLGFGRNPLRRNVDRAETLVRLAAFLVLVAVFPFALMIGAAAAHHESAVSTAQTAQRHRVTAVLTEDVPLVISSAGTNATALVQARWTDPHGATHTGPVSAGGGDRAGDRIMIWNNANGDVVDPPLTAEQVWMLGFATGLGVMLGAALVLGGVVQLVHTRLEHVRAAAWAAEWRVFGPRWSTRAN